MSRPETVTEALTAPASPQPIEASGTAEQAAPISGPATVAEALVTPTAPASPQPVVASPPPAPITAPTPSTGAPVAPAAVSGPAVASPIVSSPAPSAAGAPAARAGAPRVQYSFAAGLPAGWLTEGVVTPEAGGLRIGDGHGGVGTVCSAPLPASGPVIGTVTRGVMVNAETPPTWSRIEARALGADKKVLAGTKPENLGSKKETSAPAPATIRWTPPPGAVSWRLCVRTTGAANGSTLLVGVELE